MSTIVRVGGGANQLNYVEIVVTTGAYNVFPTYARYMKATDDGLAIAESSEYLSVIKPPSAEVRCTVLKPCTVTYMLNSADPVTKSYKTGEYVAGGDLHNPLLVVMVHKPE